MANLIIKIKRQILKHKFFSAVIIIIIIGGGFYGYNSLEGSQAQISYIKAAVEKGTITTSVSSSGQVLASNQVDIKPKVSGDITNIKVKTGEQVKAGDIIATIDATGAYKAVKDAKVNLETAQLSLEKLTKPVTSDQIMQAQNSIASAQASLDKLKLSQPIDYQTAKDSLTTAQNNLTKSYQDAFNAISNAFLNLPNIVSNINDILYSEQISASDSSVGNGQLNYSALLNSTEVSDQPKIQSYQIIAENDYKTARTAFNANSSDFKNAGYYSDTNTIENLLTETLATSKSIAQAIKSESNYISVWSDARTIRNWPVFTQVATYKTNLAAYAGQSNTAYSNIYNAQANIETYKDAIVTAQNKITTLDQNNPLDLTAAEASLKEKQSSLADLLAGTDALDIRSQELSVEQRRNSLVEAQQQLAYYTIKAPFDGIIAAVNLKAGDPASSGSAVATIITGQQIAEISLNEVDVAKIKVGQKVTLTFDAIDGLNITGQIAEIDSLGTVSQNVVTYNVKIIFDTQDQRIKSSMSTNATIITDIKTDVLIIANSAVKTDGNNNNYVQILNANGLPQNQPVTIGLANDANTEIISGLTEGDNVITQTINSNAAGNNSTQNSNSGGFGGGAFGGAGRVFNVGR